MNVERLTAEGLGLLMLGSTLVLSCGVIGWLVARHPLDRRRIASWSLFAAALLPLAAALPTRATVPWRLLPAAPVAVPRPLSEEAPRPVVDHPPQPARSESPRAHAQPMTRVEPRRRGLRWSWPLATAAAYVAGLTVVLTRRGWGLWAARRCVRSATESSADVRSVWIALAGPMADRAALLVGAQSASPCILWWGRTYVLMPAPLLVDSVGLRFALSHELAHLRHGDLPRWLATNLACSVLWFHPLAWWARREVRQAQDQLADADAAGREPAEYAEFLMRAARSLLGRAPVAGLAMASRPSALARRVHWLLKGAKPSPMGRLGLAAFLTVVGGILTAASVLRLEAAQPQPESTSPPPGPVAPVQILTVEALDALTGEPLVGALVTQIELKEGQRRDVAKLGDCDEQGRLTFRASSDRPTFEVSVQHPGYLERTMSLLLAEASQSQTARLLPEATLTGRLVQSGQGLAGARVAAVSGDLDDWKRSFVDIVTTDDAGRFKVKVARGQPTSLQVAAATSGPMEFSFDRPAADVGDLLVARAVSPNGVVEIASGAPAAGVSVRAFPQFAALQPEVVAAFRDVPRVRTDDAGKFTFPSLQPGKYWISVADEDSNLQRGIFRGQMVTARADAPPMHLTADPAAVLEVVVRLATGAGIENVRASRMLVEYVNPGDELDQRVTLIRSETKSDPAGRILLSVPARPGATDRISVTLDFERAGLAPNADIHYVAKIDGKVVDESDARIPERQTRLRIELPPNR